MQAIAGKRPDQSVEFWTIWSPITNFTMDYQCSGKMGCLRRVAVQQCSVKEENIAAVSQLSALKPAETTVRRQLSGSIAGCAAGLTAETFHISQHSSALLLWLGRSTFRPRLIRVYKEQWSEHPDFVSFNNRIRSLEHLLVP